MKKNLWIFIFFMTCCMVIPNICIAGNDTIVPVAPVIWHVHTRGWSDGKQTVTEVANQARNTGFRAVFFSDHGDSGLDDEPAGFGYYQNEINGQPLTSIAGREVTIGNIKKSYCHINAYSETSNPILSDPQATDYNPTNALNRIHGEGGFAIWNHPGKCRSMRPYVNSFDGIEIFNEYHTMNDLAIYLDAVRGGWRGFIVGGMDLHSQWYPNTFLNVITWVFTNNTSKNGILSAVQRGQTIATRNVVNLQASLSPQISPRRFSPNGSFRIGIKVKSGSPSSKYNVYKDGGPSMSSYPLQKAKTPGAYYFDFNAPSPGCYVFEIRGYMVTGLYCFQ